MNAFSPLCTLWHQQVKAIFTSLHGHQSTLRALFVLGALRAQSIVLSRVAEALLGESEATVASIERRLERFLSNSRIDTQTAWDEFLGHLLPAFRGRSLQLVVDLTAYEEHAQVISVGLLQHSRVLPLTWKVMPGQEKWEQGLWKSLEELFERIAPHLQEMNCTLLADSAFGCFPMVQLCGKYGWHYVLRISGTHTCERWSAQGRLLPTCAVSTLVCEPGKRFYGHIRLWQDEQIETNLSGWWPVGEEEALLVISDLPACAKRISDYRFRWRVESTFQDLKSRGWDWEESHVRRLDRVDHMLFVLFVLLWWLAHLAAACIHNGYRPRYDRSDRRDKGIFRLGRLYLLDVERHCSHGGELKQRLLCAWRTKRLALLVALLKRANWSLLPVFPLLLVKNVSGREVRFVGWNVWGRRCAMRSMS